MVKILFGWVCIGLFVVPFMLNAQIMNGQIISDSTAFQAKNKLSIPVIFIRLNGGFLWPHHQNMKHLNKSHAFGAELDIIPMPKVLPAWRQIYYYPVVGYSLFWLDMGNADLLGKSAGGVAFLEPNMYQNKHHRLSYRLGTGMAYSSKHFDLYTNPTNEAIGSSISFVLLARLNYAYKLSQTNQIQASLSLMHLSNGSLKSPNLGLNYPLFSLAMGFGNLNKRPTNPPDSAKKSPKSKYSLQANMTISYKHTNLGSKSGYILGGGSVYGAKRIGRKSSLLVGADIIYNPSLRNLPAAAAFGAAANEPKMSWQAAITLGHELHFGKLSLLSQLGFYVYKPLDVQPFFYHRMAFKYHINQYLFALAGLRAHYAAADCVEVGLGMKF